ncbi:LysR family transcriptional regulator [Planomonospora sp. ID67723]|uniref:LysR family transcriptional regulator n=1 Tax=Planomonospora sp. ID67723 TaxID=2738134 RepID=UPI0018C3CEBE|nr:LysR family transcriptional regulator [Planomonospora sp. ID67723]MBG0833018.1 LysR family transcriptional regulator [Planomonospora sp. ID67723]
MERPELPLPQLHAFVVLAEELHFGHAAGRLGIAQPPLSQQIRRLENKIGHPLFQRGPGRVTLTPAGRELLPAARRAITELAGGLAAARAAASGQTGRIRLGFAASLALTVLPGLLRTYRERFPGVRLDIHEMTTAPQIAALHERTIDVGLLREPPSDEPGLGFRTVLTEGFVAVLPSAHPLAAQRSVRVAKLAGEPFVLLPRAVGPGLHDQIADLCHAAGFTPRVAQRAVEWQTVCALVGAGLGVSLAPESIRRIRLEGVAFRRIESSAARTRAAVAWRVNDRNPLVERLLESAGEDPPARPARPPRRVVSEERGAAVRAPSR